LKETTMRKLLAGVLFTLLATPAFACPDLTGLEWRWEQRCTDGVTATRWVVPEIYTESVTADHCLWTSHYYRNGERAPFIRGAWGPDDTVTLAYRAYGTGTYDGEQIVATGVNPVSREACRFVLTREE
jgi:hypothetical protein